MRRSRGRTAGADDGFASNAGQPPGTLVLLGEPKQAPVTIDVMHYAEDALSEQRAATVERCSELAGRPGVTWINVNGIHDLGIIEGIGQSFGLHPLTLEDLANPYQRPRVAEFPEYISFALKMLDYDEAAERLRIEHVSLILGQSSVISFLEDEGDLFDAVRERIRTGSGRIRALRADYLAYALIDTVLDHYFMAIERIGDHIEAVDLRILSDPTPDDIQAVHRLKRESLRLRRAVWPLRDEIASLARGESALIHPETTVFLRDLYDHTIQIIEMVETFRDLLGGIHDTYLSSVSNRMNEIMKVLTIIATVFIPLTFISGVYGMNFEYMPELGWRWGYFGVWGVMLAVSAGLLWFFRRRGWM